MGNQISVDPDRLEDLANEFVLCLAKIEEEFKRLHLDLANLRLSAPPEYSHCFNDVGDPWGTGNQLADLLSEMEIDIRKTANEFAEADNLVGKLYNLYDKYGALTALGGLTTRQLAYYGIGFTQFTKNADGLFTFKHMGALNQLSDFVENSKYRGFARAFVKPSLVLKWVQNKYKDVPFSDLVHKKFAEYLPDDVAKFTNSSRALFDAVTDLNTLDSATFKSFLKTGSKFARSNVVTTLVATGAVETCGMGLKISENYAKYGNNIEVLKRENAKAVGNAVNNTVAITGGSVVGAFIGGALGSTFGPVGTVVGATGGAFVGGIVGEQVAKLTAGISEKVALAFKEPIHQGVELVKDGFKTAGKVVEGVSKGVDFVNEQIKSTIADPAGKVKEGLSKAKKTASSLIDGAKDFFCKVSFS
ncbi:hypothetical protein K6959_00050 [Bacillus aquiflavi]|uniref:hypothetical protein n=1 Tax=Bacillus aquiflavi TaxID=2672567 RepID=UPI001CA7F93F|nr:hypothetical protein [Bacillus aquiflavi]UAC48457.1 hypothetical protein K6959_00050 [Bacillus aquiflavi]